MVGSRGVGDGNGAVGAGVVGAESGRHGLGDGIGIVVAGAIGDRVRSSFKKIYI